MGKFLILKMSILGNHVNKINGNTKHNLLTVELQAELIGEIYAEDLVLLHEQVSVKKMNPDLMHILLGFCVEALPQLKDMQLTTSLSPGQTGLKIELLVQYVGNPISDVELHKFRVELQLFLELIYGQIQIQPYNDKYSLGELDVDMVKKQAQTTLCTYGGKDIVRQADVKVAGDVIYVAKGVTQKKIQNSIATRHEVEVNYDGRWLSRWTAFFLTRDKNKCIQCQYSVDKFDGRLRALAENPVGIIIKYDEVDDNGKKTNHLLDFWPATGDDLPLFR